MTFSGALSRSRMTVATAAGQAHPVHCNSDGLMPQDHRLSEDSGSSMALGPGARPLQASVP